MFPPMEETKLDIDMTFSMLSLTLFDIHKGTSLCIELRTGGASKEVLEKSVMNFVMEPISSSIRQMTVFSQRAWPSWCEPRELLYLLPRVSVVELYDSHLSVPVLCALDPKMDDTQPPPAVPCPELAVLRLPSATLEDPSVVRYLASISARRVSLGLPLLTVHRLRYGREH
ncbi:hypothetical protein OH77DRAFT_1429740 [Trametes cingulata]|nr:hypothetical protein OH77DRAFT_1429740 [Trametes cingulata]